VFGHLAPFGPDYFQPFSLEVVTFLCATYIRLSVNVSVGTLSGAVNPLFQTRPFTAFLMLKAEKKNLSQIWSSGSLCFSFQYKCQSARRNSSGNDNDCEV